MWCRTYPRIWNKWRHSARDYPFYLCNPISQSYLANVSTVTCWRSAPPPSKLNASHIKHCFLFVVINRKASNCKWSTSIAWEIMREWATILHSHKHTHPHNTHPSSQSQNKQMKSTENLKTEKTVTGMIPTTKEAAKTSEGIFWNLR